MKFSSIRKKLIFYFLSIILTLISVSIVFGVLHLVIVDKYKKIEQNIFLQYHLVDITQDIINKYNDYRNIPTSENLDRYLSVREDITETISVLKQNIVNKNSKQSLLIVENTVKNVLSETDQGIEDIQENNISGNSLHYFEANRKFSFVKENAGNLILNEINYSRLVEVNIQKVHRILILFGVILLSSLALISVGLSIFWAKKFVSPLLEIISAAKKIAGGNLEVNIDNKFLGYTDEIGDLAKAFSYMTVKLGESRSKLELQIRETEKSKLAVLGLLSDLEAEKKKVDSIVIERTRELSSEKARLLASINSLSFGFIIVDKDNNIVLQNKAISELLGLPAGSQMSVDGISKLFGGNFDIRSKAEMCLKEKNTCETKDIVFGTRFFRAIIAPVLAEEAEEAIGYVLLLEDITEAKILERSREEFFSIASHELRTPLASIRGNSQMLEDKYKDKIADKDAFEMIGDIHESSVRLIGIVNDFLEVSKLEQERIEIKKESFDVSPVIEKVIKEMMEMNDAKKIPIVFVSKSEVFPPVLSDKSRIEEILINLLGNSVKFTNRGEIKVKVDLLPGFLKVSVIDTGIGISKENQSLLFRKFQQAGEQILARDVSQGTGLGLYICRLLADKLGATIRLEKSVLGEGSTFTLSIPLAL